MNVLPNHNINNKITIIVVILNNIIITYLTHNKHRISHNNVIQLSSMGHAHACGKQRCWCATFENYMHYGSLPSDRGITQIADWLKKAFTCYCDT